MFIFTILKIFIGTPIECKVTKDSKENILPFHLKEKKGELLVKEVLLQE